MHERLRSLAPRARTATPLGITLAIVLTAATGAGAVTMRGHHATPQPQPRPLAASHLELPAAPAPAAPAPGVTARSSADVTPAQVRVPRPHGIVEATVLVTTRSPLSARKLRAIRHVSGVHATQTVSAGRAKIDGHRALVLGVDPARFRPWTPRLTARSQPLWQSIARGEMTASFDMGHQAGLPLGATVPVRAAQRVPMRVGAFASVGMSGVDAVVSDQRAGQLGLRRNTGVVVSAPHADALAIRRAVHDVAGSQAHVSLLRVVVVIRDAGEFLTRVQINNMLHAAASRVGKPYVWGATGPNAFDCSGLVQWSFAQAGIWMPRVSQQQWFAGPHVNYADARPGDLLFWHNDPTDRGNIDHVAIYAGDGMMLVAPHTGAYVEYVPVYMTNFAGVVRVDPAMAGQVG
ncbi:MAG: peptidoglycan DL-endopeptidase CwlO [Frankiaceae bacterium]|nr:peptidoglycan DL-endopeptidase CwlO [Frankiaceae bacterium]